LGCTGGPYHVQPYWGIHPEILCPGKSATIPFLETILKEVITLFPGETIHLGGDEAPKKRWKNCPDCRALQRKRGLPTIEALQTDLVNHFTRFLAERDRRLIGWNEMLSPVLSRAAHVQFWLGKKKTLWQHIRAGRQAILSNYESYYLDHSYLHSPLERVYRCEPIPADLEPQFQSNILGIEAPLWTEFVPNRARLDWQIFPRLLAVAETAWLAPVKKDYRSFETRLRAFLPQLARNGIQYAPPQAWNPPRWKRLWGWPSLMQAQTGQVEK
jgi:hexosaminidase